MNLTWREVFDTTKGSFYLYKDIWDAFKAAESVGYKYMCWNGLIYSVETQDRIELSVQDLEAKVSVGPGTPSHRFRLLMNELEKRFPDPEPFSAIAYENRFYPILDKTLQELKTLREYVSTIKDILNHE